MGAPLARLRPRDQLHYVSRNRTVLATARDGFLHGDGQQGLFVCQTRLICLYRYFINGKAPEPVGISNIEEHSQVACYITESPSTNQDWMKGALGPGGRAATEPIELRLTRNVGDGLDEQVELSNHTLQPARIRLEIEIDADFADAGQPHAELHGRCERFWRSGGNEAELTWIYTAEHDYDHQGDTRRAAIRRAVHVKLARWEQAPTYDEAGKRIRFDIDLPPQGVRRCSVVISADIDGREYSLAGAEFQRRRDGFLAESTGFEIGIPPLASVVDRAVEQARRDLIALRLYDLDTPDRGWTLDSRAAKCSAQFWADTHRGWLALLAAGIGAFVGITVYRS